MSIQIKHLNETDLEAAEGVRRAAFSAQMGIADPSQFNRGGSSTGRFYTYPEGSFGAFSDDKLVGVMYALCWGSFGYFGPLAVLPQYWGQGIAQLLLPPTIKYFETSGVRQSGLFTYSNSVKHVSLYQKFGYWPRFLTAIMSKIPLISAPNVVTFSQIATEKQNSLLDELDDLTNSVYAGLSLRKEIESVQRRNLGDTVLVYEQSDIRGFAICHFGPGSEAESEALFVKFAAVRPGVEASHTFAQLLKQCESLALSKGMVKLIAGVNTARRPAYQQLLLNGFKTFLLGVAMLQEGDEAFNTEGSFVIDDWR